jgi:hypothetical protein
MLGSSRGIFRGSATMISGSGASTGFCANDRSTFWASSSGRVKSGILNDSPVMAVEKETGAPPSNMKPVTIAFRSRKICVLRLE